MARYLANVNIKCIRPSKARRFLEKEIIIIFEITCLSCGERIHWGIGTDPRTSKILIGDFVMLCNCGQALAEGEYAMRVLAPHGTPAKGFHVHCYHCEQQEEWVNGKPVNRLHIRLSESATITCNCGVNIWNHEGILLYAWISRETHNGGD